MKRILLALALAALLAPACSEGENGSAGKDSAAGEGHTVEWGFDRLAVEKAPPGFQVMEGDWRVKKEAGTDGNVLAQTAKSGEKVYNLILAGDVEAKDVEVSAAVYPMEGEVDRGGGLVWRARDGKNYYVCRWNPLESNYRVYKVIDGERTQLGSALAPDDQVWHTLRATMQGNRIECFLDDEKLLEVEDDSLPDAGKVGLWTKADAVTFFRDFRAAWE